VDAGWWQEVTRRSWQLLALAAAALALHFALRAGGEAARMPARLAADFYLWATILCVLGWSHHRLNRPWPWLAWAGEQVYPWYVLHQTVIIVLVFWLAPLQLRAPVEAALLVAGTLLGCWGLTAMIRRIAWLRPLFGLKPPVPPRCPSPAWPERPAAHSGG